MSFMGSMTTSATGMTAQQLRTDLISQNLANVNTTRDENGDPYRRKVAVFAEKTNKGFGSVLNNALGVSGQGVKVTQVVEDTNTDMKTGLSAGLTTVGVTWGFREREELESFHPQYVIDHPGEVCKILP